VDPPDRGEAASDALAELLDQPDRVPVRQHLELDSQPRVRLGTARNALAPSSVERPTCSCHHTRAVGRNVDV